ncbi:MAG: hypothetical protein JWP81_5190 [Ferruginibacter sp.]|nr:hypothetical protein [Ferruginibacter sp.]
MEKQDRRGFLKTGSVLSASVIASSIMTIIPPAAKASSETKGSTGYSKGQSRTLGSGKHSIKSILWAGTRLYGNELEPKLCA